MPVGEVTLTFECDARVLVLPEYCATDLFWSKELVQVI